MKTYLNLIGMADWGTEGLPANAKKRVRMSNRTAQVLMLIVLVYIPGFILMNVPSLAVAHLVYFCGYVISLLINKGGKVAVGKSVLLATGNFTLFFNSYTLGQTAGVEFYYAPMVMGPFLLYEGREWRLQCLWATTPILLLIGNFLLTAFVGPRIELPQELLTKFWYFNFTVVVLLCGFLAFFMMRSNDHAMDEVHNLKVQQDGDYFLTSLVSSPLSRDANTSDIVLTEILISQKKKLQFKTHSVQIGGDLCITGNLTFLGQKHLFFVNADAMGKSLQGASGAIAFGAYVNSLLKTGRKSGVDNIPYEPAHWLGSVCRRLSYLFETFDGSMAISCVIGTVNEKTGQVCYANIEHPRPVLYRDKSTRFIGLPDMHKIGHLLPEPEKLVFRTFQMQPEDVLIIGSDGRDDILSQVSGSMLHQDEEVFLDIVRNAEASLPEIVQNIEAYGQLVDDLSLIRIEYKPA